MANDWYIKINNSEHGPLSSDNLKQLAQQGKIRPETPLKNGVAGDWLPARQLRGLFSETDSRSVPATSTPPPNASVISPSVARDVSPPIASWYLCEIGKTFGPYSDADLKEMAREGTIGPIAQVKEGEHGNWRPFAFRKVREKAGKPHIDPPPTAGEQVDDVDEIAAKWLEPTPQDSAVPISPQHAVPQNIERPISSPPVPSLPSNLQPVDSATVERACPFCGETILAVATKCKHCGEFISGKGPSVSQNAAGTIAVNPRKSGPVSRSIVGGGGVVSIITVVIVWWSFSGQSQNHDARSIAADNIKQYEIAVSYENHATASLQAGIIANAFLDAKDEVNFRKWKAIQEQEFNKNLKTPSPPFYNPLP